MQRIKPSSHRIGRWALGLVLTGLPTVTARAEIEKLFAAGRAATQGPYLAPGRMFQLTLAPDWRIGPNPGKNDTVEFHLSRPGQGSGVLRIHRRPVAAGAQARALMLHALEQRRHNLPFLHDVETSERMVGGLKAAVFRGQFQWQGNIEYPRVVEETFVVLGQEVFELHLEAFPVLFVQSAGEREAMWNSFVPRPSAEAPPAPEEDDEALKLDNLPF